MERHMIKVWIIDRMEISRFSHFPKQSTEACGPAWGLCWYLCSALSKPLAACALLESVLYTSCSGDEIDTSSRPSQHRKHLLSSVLAASSPVICRRPAVSVLASRPGDLNHSRHLQNPLLCFNFPCVSPLWYSAVSCPYLLHPFLSCTPIIPLSPTSPLSSHPL